MPESSEVTLAGAPFAHLLCVFVLPFSNWMWVTVCLSESMAALRRGVHAALSQLGHVPKWHQTDHSSAATHRLPVNTDETGDTPARERPFNAEYLALMRHLRHGAAHDGGGAKEQNGDVEAANGALKPPGSPRPSAAAGTAISRAAKRGRALVQQLVGKLNGSRQPRLAEELAAMQPLGANCRSSPRISVRVAAWSTIG